MSEREPRLATLANRLVDVAFAECEGNLGEIAYVFTVALTAVLRTRQTAISTEWLARACRMMHLTLWTNCKALPRDPGL